MYNFICTSDKNAWFKEHGNYNFPKDRLFEYTVPELKNDYADRIRELANFPCIFTNEDGSSFHIGKITKMSIRSTDIRITYEYFAQIPKDLAAYLWPEKADENTAQATILSRRLDIQRGQMYRTHWALKDEDLFEALEQESIFPKLGVKEIRDWFYAKPDAASGSGETVTSDGSVISKIDLNPEESKATIFSSSHYFDDLITLQLNQTGINDPDSLPDDYDWQILSELKKTNDLLAMLVSKQEKEINELKETVKQMQSQLSELLAQIEDANDKGEPTPWDLFKEEAAKSIGKEMGPMLKYGGLIAICIWFGIPVIPILTNIK